MHAPPDPYRLVLDCDKPSFYVKGETITVYGRSNSSISLTLNVFWNWKSFSDNVLVYNNTKSANATWTLPTANSNVGYYKLVLTGANQTVTIWRTLVHFKSYLVDSLPFNYEWQGVNYTLEGRTFTASMGNDALNLTYPKIPVSYSVSFLRNNMTFLIRLSGSGWAVDICYMALYSGLKWAINGTLSDPQTFEFQCTNNPLGKWVKGLDQWKSTNMLTFDWSDIRRAVQAFSWNNQTNTLSVTIPSNFSIDPSIFSDGFESGDFTAWTSESESGVGVTNAVAANSVHHGSWSYEVQGLNVANEWGKVSKTLPATYDALYARTYVRFNNCPAENSWFNINGPILMANNVDIIQPGYTQNAGGKKWGAFCNDATLYSHGDYEVINSDQWYLIEVYAKISTGNVKMWVDEDLKIDQTLSLGAAAIDTFLIAGYVGANLGSAQVFINDCAVVSETYIGPEVSGQNLVFTNSQSLSPSSSISFLNALGFQSSESIFPSGTGYFWKAVGFQAIETILPSSSSSFNKAVEFLTSGAIILWDSTAKVMSLSFIQIDIINFWETSQMAKAMGAVVSEYLSGGILQLASTHYFNKELAFLNDGLVSFSSSASSTISIVVAAFESFGTFIITSSSTLTTIITATIDMALAIGALALILSITGIGVIFLRRRRD